MEKRLTCRMLGFDCDFVARDESEEELLKKYADHAEKIHRRPFTKELRGQAVSLIRKAA